MVDVKLTDYVVTRMPDGTYAVWHDDLPEPYQVVWIKGNRFTCNCPDYFYRRRHENINCKHGNLIKEKGAWNDSVSEMPQRA